MHQTIGALYHILVKYSNPNIVYTDHRLCCFGCFERVSKSFQVLSGSVESGIEAAIVLTLIILK